MFLQKNYLRLAAFFFFAGFFAAFFGLDFFATFFFAAFFLAIEKFFKLFFDRTIILIQKRS